MKHGRPAILRRGVRSGTLCVLAAALAGCASHYGMGAGTFTSHWDLGSCHLLDQDQDFALEVQSETSPPVRCDQPHTSETFQISNVTDPVVLRSRERPSPFLTATAARSRCDDQLLQDYLGAKADQIPYGLRIVGFVPTRPEWRSGLRTVRCDVVVNPAKGRTAADAAVTFSLAGVLHGPHADQFLLCQVTDPDGTEDDMSCADKQRLVSGIGLPGGHGTHSVIPGPGTPHKTG